MIRFLAQRFSETLLSKTRPLDIYYRDAFDEYAKPHLQALTQKLIRATHLHPADQHLAIAEERYLPNEAQMMDDITSTMNRFLESHYQQTGRVAERAGNTKTYGVVKAQFTVNADLPKNLKVGLFKQAKTFPAYIRFGGPGPLVVPDPQDNGILSIGIKVMQVPGKKLMDEEQHTQDFLGISCPTFTTPDLRANRVLQKEIGRNTPAWYFLNPFDPHWLDAAMQGLYSRLYANPLEVRYFSCTPYLMGEGQAVKFSMTPRVDKKSKLNKLGDNYLRDAMVKTLKKRSVIFDLSVQLQLDPYRMPLEDASVEWLETESPFIPVATIEIPKQSFNSQKQHAFARRLRFNPWHAIAAHRPLGNQNRARLQIYHATAATRQAINNETHIEPTGDEQF
jgi:hypothetical protein